MGSPQTRRGFLLLPSLALGAAMSALFVRPVRGTRFILEPVGAVPSAQLEMRLETAVALLDEQIYAACFVSGRAWRAGPTIVVGLVGYDPEHHEFVNMQLRHLPIDLRITKVERGLVDVRFDPPGREWLRSL